MSVETLCSPLGPMGAWQAYPIDLLACSSKGDNQSYPRNVGICKIKIITWMIEDHLSWTYVIHTAFSIKSFCCSRVFRAVITLWSVKVENLSKVTSVLTSISHHHVARHTFCEKHSSNTLLLLLLFSFTSVSLANTIFGNFFFYKFCTIFV